jgi:hypothetical protein
LPVLKQLPVTKPIALIGLMQLVRGADAPAVLATYKVHSVDSVQHAELGSPVAVFTVPADSLNRYEAGKPIASLLVDEQRVLYPVQIVGKTRLLITVRRGRAGWIPAEYGGPTDAPEIFSARDTSMAGKDTARAHAFLVDIDYASPSFIGVWNGAELDFTPIADDQRGRWKRWETHSASYYFKLLAHTASPSDRRHSS